MSEGDGRDYPSGGQTPSTDELTVDELIDTVRPLTATSPISTTDILDALDADRR